MLIFWSLLDVFWQPKWRRICWPTISTHIAIGPKFSKLKLLNFWSNSSSFYHAPFGRFSFLFVALYNSFFILSFLFYWAKYMSQKGDNLVVQALLQLTCFSVKFPTWSFDFFNKFKMASIKCHLLFSSCVWAHFSYGKVRRYWLYHTSSYIFVHF